MTSTGTNCETTFRHVDRNEDGSPAIESTPSAHPGCAVYPCQAGCEHLSFRCEPCNKRFCLDRPSPSMDALLPGVRGGGSETQETECEYRQTGVDLFDARGCDLHASESPRKLRLRAVTAIREYDRYQDQDQRRAYEVA